MSKIRPSAFTAGVVLLFGASLMLTASAANVHFSWAQAPDYESPAPTFAAQSGRLVVIEVDGLRRDHAFDAELMPNLCQLKEDGAGGPMLTTEMVMTGICVRTMWTGVSPDILAILKNWNTGTVEADSFFRQADRSNLSVAMLGDDSLTNQFGAWADYVHGEADGGIKNINESDDRTWALGRPLVNDTDYDVVVLHLAGLDHAGHTYMLDSPQYRAKCRWLDGIINETASALDPRNDTLAVLVDHAQTDSGYHGFGEYEPRDVAFVLWGRGVRPGAEASIEQKDVASTLCALMGLAMPAHGEGVPCIGVLNVTHQEGAAILLYAARLRADYVRVYSDSTGSGISFSRRPLEEAEAAYSLGDWNGTAALARESLAATNQAYYDSLSPSVASLVPVVAGAFLALACAASLLWAPPSRLTWVILVCGLLLLCIGAAEVAFGAIEKRVVHDAAWRWIAGTASLLLCIGAMAASVLGKAWSGARRAVLEAPVPALAWLAFIAVVEIAMLAGYTSLLEGLYDKSLTLKMALGLAGAAAAAASAAGAYFWARRLEVRKRGPVMALFASSALLLLSVLFAKHLVVASAAGVAAAGAWLVHRVFQPSQGGGTLDRAAAVVSALSLFAVMLLVIVNIGATVWGDFAFTNLDNYPRYLAVLSAAVAVGLVAVYARANPVGLVRAFGGAVGITVLGLAVATAGVFHYIPVGETALLDWVARSSILLSVGAFALSLASRERESLMLASAVSLYCLLATPGQCLVFTLILAPCLFVLRRSSGTLGRGIAGHAARGVAVVLLVYAAFTALGYGFNFTSVDIRASTIGQTELFLPWAVLVISVKYNIPALLALWAFTDSGEEAMAAALVAIGLLSARSAQIAVILFTGVEQFRLIVPFTGELLHILIFVPGMAAFAAFLQLQRRPKGDRIAARPPEASPSSLP